MRRALYFLAFVLAIALLPFGVILLSIPLTIRAQVAAIDSNWHPDTEVLFWARFWSAIYGVSWPFVLAILHNEGASEARVLSGRELSALAMPDMQGIIGYPVGDIGDSRGPSVGSGQVLVSNVLSLWNQSGALQWAVTAESPEQLALQGRERQAMWASVKMMREALDANARDLHAAARYYNGGPHGDERATLYADKAIASIARIGA